MRFRFHVSNILKHLPGLLVHFFGVLSALVFEQTTSPEKICEYLMLLLGILLRRRWSQSWAKHTLLLCVLVGQCSSFGRQDQLLKQHWMRCEGWRGGRWHMVTAWQDCTSRWPERKMCNQISLSFLSSSWFTWNGHCKGHRFLGRGQNSSQPRIWSPNKPANEVSSLFPELIFGKDRHELLADAKSALWQADNAGAWCWEQDDEKGQVLFQNAKAQKLF